ncbi:hypothetical protein [Xanthomonas translucens]|uniref:hypothetical protein n=1 Tax=Xanthomonas campestris pv. translucens TaxID=343 RepID=UPI0002A21238|nr:hypothetical protein [Xanthomonas translucens]KTF39303.1 hypothetical protein OZ12_12915 [Xanthomonas translucens pv. translucens]KWV14563.1 hypothetical protein ATB54_11755 [Xanthomonas translucens]MCC8447097.1 hypothetical protein [Xanthomonas translucens pv. translucens]MCS3361651.1 hypothetical protein [Xanthomonas translucens pv. translucens]MCS3375219.1 hypothetical protein [Xanthomonas translucens pv. translucens]
MAILAAALLVGLLLVLWLPPDLRVFGASLTCAAGGGLIGLGVTRAWCPVAPAAGVRSWGCGVSGSIMQAGVDSATS